MKKVFSIVLFAYLIILFSCKTDKTPPKNNDSQPASKPLVDISYNLTGTLPHDINSFTEGLLFYEGKLYESTGSPEEFPNAKSVIGEVDLKTGNLNVKVEIDRKKFFGEGIVFLNGKVFQLTYKNQLGFIYDAKTFKNIGTFKYINNEGWGLTTDGKSLIMSDGTDKITYLNPETFTIEKTLNVKTVGGPVPYINELEMINGYIYANLWTSNIIMKIDPSDGSVVGKIDLTALQQDAKSKNPKIAEMNGIAYNPNNNMVFVTGKFWPHIYQIDFSK